MANGGWGQRLKARARELGLSDVDVARRLEISQQRYSSYVNEVREPHFAEFIRICHILGTTPDTMLGIIDTSSQDAFVQRAAAALEAMPSSLRPMAVSVLETMAVQSTGGVTTPALKAPRPAGRKPSTSGRD